jgi:hypothetical protein
MQKIVGLNKKLYKNTGGAYSVQRVPEKFIQNFDV